MKVPIKAPACKRIGPTAFEEEDGCYKDVYGDLAPGETPEINLLRHIFACAGYEVKRVEKSDSHPVAVVRAICKKALPITDQRLLRQHIRHLLRDAGFRLKQDELSVSRTGNRLLVAFQTGDPPADFEEILREPQEDMMDYVDMPL